MKTIKIFFFLVISFQASCQVTAIEPLFTTEYINGAYLKDIDDQFPYWEGTWTGTINNKTYTFEFTKITQKLIPEYDDYYHYEDQLVGNIKITNNTNNSVVINTLNNNNYELYKLTAVSISANDILILFYDNNNNNVMYNFSYILKMTTQSNVIKFCMFTDPEVLSFDPQIQTPNDVPLNQHIPTQTFTLTKQ